MPRGGGGGGGDVAIVDPLESRISLQYLQRSRRYLCDGLM
jgi:hypothetical protein